MQRPVLKKEWTRLATIHGRRFKHCIAVGMRSRDVDHVNMFAVSKPPEDVVQGSGNSTRLPQLPSYIFRAKANLIPRDLISSGLEANDPLTPELTGGMRDQLARLVQERTKPIFRETPWATRQTTLGCLHAKLRMGICTGQKYNHTCYFCVCAIVLLSDTYAHPKQLGL